MDQVLRHFNERNQLWGEKSTTGRQDIQLSEVGSKGCTNATDVVHRTVRADEVHEWLSSSEGEATSVPCLQIVWIEYDRTEDCIDIDIAVLDRLLQKFRLQDAYRYSSTAFAGVVSLPPQKEGNEVIRTYSICYHPKLAISWSRNAASPVIRAVVVVAAREQIASFKDLLPSISCLVGQEMVVALLCGLMLGTEVDRAQYLIKEEVREVEVRTGFHRWAERKEQPAAGNLAALSARMSGCATKMASIARKIKMIQEVCGFIIEQLPPTEQPVRHADGKESDNADAESTSTLIHFSRLLMKRAEMQQIDVDFFHQRVSIQLGAVRLHLQSPPSSSCSGSTQVTRYINHLVPVSLRTSSLKMIHSEAIRWPKTPS